ncbi:hypothetical protein SAMN06265379_11255 [Saccharicrinis carchari]|uniref:Uncharacterized protein n=1 Tax=Saccharicrinis carchari TaxID=1168039 RepID=A0A521F0E8_SACCC|nr:hypothetical protein SAMN06265379_11255 [Saccharicrinis carchari]
MKSFKIYKINAKPIVFGLDLSLFYIFITAIVICVFVLISKVTLTKLLLLSLVVIATYIVLKILSDKNIVLSMLKDKLPKKIRNAL